MKHSSLIYSIARGTVSFIWIYHGLVPKLLMKHPDEAAPLLAAGFSMPQAAQMVRLAGWFEIVIGISLLLFWRARAGFWLTIVAMSVALVGVGLLTPHLLTAAFNPVSLNLGMVALSLIGLCAHSDNKL